MTIQYLFSIFVSPGIPTQPKFFLLFKICTCLPNLGEMRTTERVILDKSALSKSMIFV